MKFLESDGIRIWVYDAYLQSVIYEWPTACAPANEVISALTGTPIISTEDP